MALQALSTTLSLGSIRLYQSSANSLLRSVQQLIRNLGQAYQSVFFFAAFCEATQNPEEIERRFRRRQIPFDVPLIDYEKVREEDGMTIQARHLGFTYPGTQKEVLKDIDLDIKAGETLAIVGFNASGKSTLIKCLMGLYDHTGTLLINGRPVEHYDAASLHRRTSCLFQDFGRYNFSLRENVGIGNLEYMVNDEELEVALELGGADSVKQKVGWDGRLDRYQVPDIAEDQLETNANLPKQNGNAIPASDEPKPNGTGVAGATHSAERVLASAKKLLAETASRIGPRKRAMDLDADQNNKGKALSGGQWQRVALARAFLRAPDADLVVFE